MKSFRLEDAHNFIEEQIFALCSAGYRRSFPDWPGHVGLEIEMQPFFSVKGGSVVPKALLDEVLLGWAKDEGWKPLWEDSDHGPVVTKIDLDQGDTISFEPGGQVEFSSKPYPFLSDAIKRSEAIQAELDRRLLGVGVGICQIGINPWHTVPEIGLQMQKPRYGAMNQYFSQLSEYGPRMMRQTCTVQVCLDFGSKEEILAKRYLLSQLLVPFASAVFCHSPVVDGSRVKEKSFRVNIWTHMDQSRSGFPPALEKIAINLNKSSCVESYLDFALQAKVIFVKALSYEVPSQPLTFREWVTSGYKGVFPTQEDWLTHMSLLFPEVRPKGFLELRSIDAQHRLWQEAPAAFYMGLLYDEQNLNRALDLLLPHLKELNSLWREAPYGLEHPVLKACAQKLVLMAIEGYTRLTSSCEGQSSQHLLSVFYEQFTAKARTPAHDLCDSMDQLTVAHISEEVLQKTSDLWVKCLAK